MTEEDIKGNHISIQWDNEKGEDWIIIKDCSGKIIMKVKKEFWDFDINFRDDAVTKCRGFYG